MIAPLAGVAVVACPLLSQFIGLADGRVQVEGKGRVAGSGPSGPCAREQLAAYAVEMTDVPRRKLRRKVRWVCGWRLECAAENTDRPTGALRVRVVDAVAASQRGGDQRQQLVPRVFARPGALPRSR